MGLEEVQLKNGSREPEVAVRATMVSLRLLMSRHPIAFYELVEVCRDKTHQPFGNAADILKSLGLMEPDGGIHDTIHNIVLSSVTGEGLDLGLASPLAEQNNPQ